MKKILSSAFVLLAAGIIIFFCFYNKPDTVESQSSGLVMGSVATVKTFTDTAESGKQKQTQILEKLRELDRLISKNDENAELYKINEKSGSENTVEGELFDYIKQTKEIYAVSGGRLSVTSGALTELWGIDTDAFRLPSQAEIDAALPLCNDSLITLNGGKMTVKTAEGQVVNLGSVGKGIACDKARELLDLNPGDCTAAVVSVGGSVGLFGERDENNPWTVGIRDPFGAQNDYFAKLVFKESNVFVSTSGSYEKVFEENGKTYHHILDLTTGYPVETGLVSVTVSASTGLLSDALSTLCFVMGEEASKPILDKYSAYAVFVYSDRTVSDYGNGDIMIVMLDDNSGYILK